MGFRIPNEELKLRAHEGAEQKEDQVLEYLMRN